VRRVAIDWAGARSGVAGAVAVRKVGDGTVEAWKKARSKSGARGGTGEGAGGGAGAGTSDAMRDTLERGPGLDVRNAVKEGGTAPAPDAPRKPKADEPAAGAGGDEETTSRLLRAKRRATGGEGDGADGKGGGGG